MIYVSANASGEIVKLKSLEIIAATEQHKYKGRKKEHSATEQT